MADDAVRQTLNELVGCVTGLPSTGNDVFEDPTHAIAKSRIPAVAVEPVEDAVERAGVSQDGGWIDVHALRVRFTALARTPHERDAVGLEIKQAVIAATGIGRERRYAGATYSRSGDGERDYYAAHIVFEFEIATTNTTPDVLIVQPDPE